MSCCRWRLLQAGLLASGAFSCAMARRGFDVRGGAHPGFNALGSARQPFFLLLVQKKEGKEKDPRRLAPCWRKGFPALLGQNRRCGTRDLRSLRQSSLLPVLSCDARRRQRDRGALIGLQSAPSPWCSRAPQVEKGSARGLSDRAQRGSSAAPFFYRGAQGSRSEAETKPWGALSFRLFIFGQAKKRDLRAGQPPHSKLVVRRRAHRISPAITHKNPNSI